MMFEFDSSRNIARNAVSNLELSKDDPCIWVVYPGGAGGDLLAAIINSHFFNTFAKFEGITDRGQVKFMPSDGIINEITNRRTESFKFDSVYFDKLNQYLTTRPATTTYRDQFIFSNHCWDSKTVSKILMCFTNCKIIRILPKNNFENQIINWLGMYKNKNINLSIPDTKNVTNIPIDNIVDIRLLNVYFSDLLNHQRFENTYDQIVDHLNLERKLIRFEFIEYWLKKQHKYILPFLLELAK
jgi:hypothetical protein